MTARSPDSDPRPTPPPFSTPTNATPPTTPPTGATNTPTLGPASPTSASALAEGPGTRIGDYTLLQLLGEGGFGSVFLAEQHQPVQRRVALKIIKLGMDTRQVIARFEAERQALALMEHPNIARVLDAGATSTGRPFFVMELVKGDPITQYCDRYRLPIRQRLELFEQVCAAVQHAHQKGIIHRDIKPSNILVSAQDSAPVAKVIDFGVAKATSARLTERTLFTEHRQIIGTPEYMSPEQAEGSLDIDTRTDVYSLGVLLYELLTGQTPFDSHSLRSAAYAEIQRMIREVDPPKPSTRVLQSASTLATAAASRSLEPRRLGSIVRGELDWIVMKAMDKDRTRRYDSASNLAADIHRYLDGQAILAAPPSAAYRARKFVRRNKGVVVATAAVALALLIGAIAFAWQASIARQQRDAAVLAQTAEAEQRRIADHQRDRAVEAEAQTAQRAAQLTQVAEFQSAQLTDLDPSLMGIRLRDSILSATLEDARPTLSDSLDHINFTNIALDTLSANIFDRTLAAIDTQFAQQPLVRARLFDTLALTLDTLGMSDRALAPITQALTLRRAALGADHPDTLTSLRNMGRILQSLGRYDEVIPCFQEALDSRRRILDPDHPDTLESLADSAYFYILRSQHAQAEALYREAVERGVRVQGREHRQTLAVINGLGYSLVMQGKLAEAEPLWRETYETGTRTLGPGDKDVIIWTNNMGGLLDGLGRSQEAEAHYRRAWEANRRLLGDDHPTTLACAGNVAIQLDSLGRHADAQAIHRATLAARERVQGPSHPQTLDSVLGLANALRNAGSLAEAEPLYQRVLSARRRILGNDHDRTLDAMGGMARHLALMNRFEESDALYREIIDTARRVSGPEHPQTLTSINNYGVLLINQRRYEVAEPILTEALEIRRRVSGPEHPATLTAQSSLGRTLLALDKLEQAEALFVPALDAARRAWGPDHPFTYNAVANMGLLRRRQQRFDQAEPFLREAADNMQRILGKDHATTATIRHRLASTLLDLQRFPDAQTEFLEAERVLGSAQGVSAAQHTTCVNDLIALYEAWELAQPDQGHAAQAQHWRDTLPPPPPETP